MGWINGSWLETLLTRIASATHQVVLTELPTDYKEAFWPGNMWTPNTAYNKGDIVTAPLPANYGEQVLDNVFWVYECITPGTSNDNEPVFPRQRQEQFAENNDLSWITHRNTVLAMAEMVPEDFTTSNMMLTAQEAGDIPNYYHYIGIKLIVAEKQQNPVYRNGQANWVALLNNDTKDIVHVTKAAVPSGGSTTGSQYVLLKGNYTTMYAYGIEHKVVWP